MNNIKNSQDTHIISNHEMMAAAIRKISIDVISECQTGHHGMPLGMADVMTVLSRFFLNISSKNTKWINRDRLVLSAGHGSMLLYSALYLMGMGINLDDIKNFRKKHSKTPGHPEVSTPGIEATTGPLGHGIGNGVGMAISEEKLRAQYPEIIDHHTYIMAGDGCLMEGISHEACALAGHLNLSRIIMLFDSNQVSIDGPVSLADSTHTTNRFKSYGWHVQNICGHDPVEIFNAIKEAKITDKPSIIICNTTIGYGLVKAGGTNESHSAPVDLEDVKESYKAFLLSPNYLEIPQDIKIMWEGCVRNDEYDKWLEKFNASKSQYASLQSTIEEKIHNTNIIQTINDNKKTKYNTKACATRSSSQEMLEAIINSDLFIGGSADLSHSCKTITSQSTLFTAQNRLGNYIHYGIREHGMSAVMNGIALHGHFIPYGSSFLIFSDYCKPGIRLSALMELKVVYVFTHDSIGVGEDGPTHQPIEQLAGLRATPNLNVFRPANQLEVYEAWQVALQCDMPSVISLSRHNVSQTMEYREENLCKFGAYWVHKKENAEFVLYSCGSELCIADSVCKELNEAGIVCSLVSFPCIDIFHRQSEAYKSDILNSAARQVVVDAGSRMSWFGIAKENAILCTADEFGMSAKCSDVYEHFKITKQDIISKIKGI